MQKKILAALIEEQRVKFAVVMVEFRIWHNEPEKRRIRSALSFRVFPGLPLVLATRDHQERIRYEGREDIVRFLERVDPRRLPWAEYSIQL